MTTLKVILIVLGAILLYLALVRVFRKLYHFPAPAFIERFLDKGFVLDDNLGNLWNYTIRFSKPSSPQLESKHIGGKLG